MENHLHWRYATKKFDPSKKIPKEELAHLLEALRFSPSSCGLQPWKFMIIHEPVLRKQLREHAHHQAQVMDSDTLIVLCALKSVDERYVQRHIDHIAKTHGVSKESLLGFQNMILGFLGAKDAEAISHWMKNQVYIALGFLLAECAYRQIDACPMEGFDRAQFDEILQLPQQGLESVVLCAIGYRASDDPYAHLKKVRFDANEIFKMHN